MTNERRRFFRINDTVGVSYRLLTKEEQLHCDKERLSDPLAQIATYNKKIEQGLSQLRIKEPLAGDVLDNINKKLNSIIRQLELENTLVERLAVSMQEVNISACGMAFFIDEPLNPGQLISLDLVLNPNSLHIYTQAEIVDCRKGKEGNYYIRVGFQNMSSSDQEILIQHIVKRQSSMIRMDRTRKL